MESGSARLFIQNNLFERRKPHEDNNIIQAGELGFSKYATYNNHKKHNLD